MTKKNKIMIHKDVSRDFIWLTSINVQIRNADECVSLGHVGM